MSSSDNELSSGSPTAEDLLDRLRASGARVTAARRAVIQALVDGGPHPTAEDLAAKVVISHPDVHRSSVYRTLDALAEIGVVSHVHLGHGSAVYHLSDDDDLHLLCRLCGAVDHIPSTAMAAAARSIEQETGFAIRPGHYALSGLCERCK